MALGSLPDPIPNYKYGVEIDGVLVAGFTSCSGLEVSRETLELVEGGVNDHVHVLPGPLEHGHLTLKRGIAFTTFLWDWFHQGGFDAAVQRRPVTIYRYDLTGALASTWSIRDAYPVKWVGAELRADSRELAVETLELAFGGRRSGGKSSGGAAGGGGPHAGGGGVASSGGNDLSDSDQRQLAEKVVKLLKDAMRVECERAGKVGGS